MAEKGSEQRLRTKYIHIAQQLNKSQQQLAKLSLVLPTKANITWLTNLIKYYQQQIKAKKDFLARLEQMIIYRQERDKRGKRTSKEPNQQNKSNTTRDVP